MLRFQVEGMSCGHCIQAVTRAVKAEDPQAEVAVDLAGKSVSVTSAHPADAIAEAIRGAGYEVAAA
jgi:copper chaperone